MLKRVNAALYEANRGEQVELFVVAQGNGGSETASFEYNNTGLSPHPVQGHPGCSFTLDPGTHQFECIVVLNPASPAARYDLFEVNSAGGSTALNKNITAADPTPIIGFAIDGVAPADALAAGPSRGLARGVAAPAGPRTLKAAKKAKSAKVRKPAAKPKKKPAKAKAKAKKARATSKRAGTKAKARTVVRASKRR